MKNSEKIDRLDFLKKMGFSGAALMAVFLGESCSKSSDSTVSPITPFSIDLTSTIGAPLKTTGNYLVQNNVVVANIGTGKYAAVTRICSHENNSEVIFQNGIFYCPVHGAQFSTAGAGLNSNGSKGLKTYTVTVSGNILSIS